MNQVDDAEGRSDEQEQARLLAFDALLQAAASPKLAPTGQPARRDQGYDRLRLLLKLLEASASDDDDNSVADDAFRGNGCADARPLLDRFDVIDHLGSGGFGFVVRARDRLLGREVALKMPLPERVLSTADVHRFLREAQSAARLDHPNIVRVFDAGELGPFGYFIASEFCAGPNLRRWLGIQTGPLAPLLAARLIAALASAVQHAHERGIFHRDIKPDNVILSGGPEPEKLIPRLTDFGLAKLVADNGDETRSEAKLGTPHYMAPEQAAGRRRDVGPATDIYALGVTLYEVLTGRVPFRGESDAETMRLVLDSEPVAPRLLRIGLPRDLETICLRCLRKAPSQRYVSAAALGDDLARFIDGRPVLSRPVSMWERACGWALRRPAVAALLALVVLLASGLIGGIAWSSARLRRDNVQLQLQIARADRHAADAEQRQRLAERHRYAEGLRRARQALDSGQVELAQDLLHDLTPEPDEIDHRGFAWRYLWRQAHRDISQLWGHESYVLGITVSPDGKMLVTRDSHGKAMIWDLKPDTEPDKPRVVFSTPRGNWNQVWFSPDGRLMAMPEYGSPTPGLDLFETLTARHVGRISLKNDEDAHAVCFDLQRRRMAIAIKRHGKPESVGVWDLAPHLAPWRTWMIGNDGREFEFSADARYLAVNRGQQLTLHDPWTGERRRVLYPTSLDPIGPWCITNDGRCVAMVAAGKRILVWETDSGRVTDEFDSSSEPVCLVFSPSGSRLAMMDSSGHVTIWDRQGRRAHGLPQILPDHRVRAQWLVFSPDESLLAFSFWAEPGGVVPVEVWDLRETRRPHVFPGRDRGRGGTNIKFLPGGRSLIIGTGTTPRIWRLDAPTEPDALAGHASEAWATAFSPDGKVLATGGDDKSDTQTIRLWDVVTGCLISGWQGHTATVAALAFSPHGHILASVSLDSGKPGNPNVILWDASSCQRLSILEGHTGRVRSVAFSPNGRLLATGSDDTTVRLWDVGTGRPKTVLSGHTNKVTAIAFGQDGNTLVSTSLDETICLWDVGTGKVKATLSDVNSISAVAVAPDGSIVASANEEGQIKLWNLETGEPLGVIPGEADQLRCLTFSPDSRSVVAAGDGTVVRVWDVATGQELLALHGHEAPINDLAFSPDGSMLASCDHAGKVKLWRGEAIKALAVR